MPFISRLYNLSTFPAPYTNSNGYRLYTQRRGMKLLKIHLVLATGVSVWKVSIFHLLEVIGAYWCLSSSSTSFLDFYCNQFFKNFVNPIIFHKTLFKKSRTLRWVRKLPCSPLKHDLILCNLFLVASSFLLPCLPLVPSNCLHCKPSLFFPAPRWPDPQPWLPWFKSTSFQLQGNLLLRSLNWRANTIHLLNRPKGLLSRSRNSFIHLSAPFWSKQLWCSAHQHLYLVQKVQHLFEPKNQRCYLGGLFEVSFVVAV